MLFMCYAYMFVICLVCRVSVVLCCVFLRLLPPSLCLILNLIILGLNAKEHLQTDAWEFVH